jgi:hypothetical protein
VFTDVGRVTDDMHAAVGMTGGDQFCYLAGIGYFAGAAGSP